MIDTSWVMRDSNYFTKEMLKDYILNEAGGSSLTFLKFITGLEVEDLLTYTPIPKKISEIDFRQNFQAIHDHFHSYNGSLEPALVHGFKVDARFKSGAEGTNCHTAPGLVFDKANAVMAGGKMVSHSMLLIGARYCFLNDDYMFCLQNWWSGKFLVTVSAEYLASCGAKILFIPEHVDLNITGNFQTVNADYAEGSTPGEDSCADDIGAGEM
jgi:hypothetical protein